MPVEVACPNCQVKLKAPDGMVGRKARCKKCQTSFVIPGGSTEAGAESVMLSTFDGVSNEAVKSASATEPSAAETVHASSSQTVSASASAASGHAKAAGELARKPVAEARKPASGPPAAKAPAATPPAEPSEAAPPADTDLPPSPSDDTPPPEDSGSPFDFGVTSIASAAKPRGPSTKAAPRKPNDKAPAATKADAATKDAAKVSAKADAKAPSRKKPAAEENPPEAESTFDFTSGNPFAITNLLAPDTPQEKAEKESRRAKASAKGAESEEDEEHPRYRGPDRGGSNKILLIAGVLALIAVVGGVAAVMTIMEAKRKQAEAQRLEEEKRKAQENPPPPPEEPPPPPPPPPAQENKAPPPQSKGNNPPGQTKKGTVPVSTTPPPDISLPQQQPPKAKGPAAGPVPNALKLPSGVKTFTVKLKPTKGLEFGSPPNRAEADVAIATLRRAFPPEEDAERCALLYDTPGKARSLTLKRFFQGEQQGTLTVPADGGPLVCDVSPDTLQFAIVQKGVLSVYEIGEDKPMASWDVYGRPEFSSLRTPGVVAVFFGPNPAIIATVAGTGDVHLWDVKNKRIIGAFAPSPAAEYAPVDAQAVTVDDERKNVVVAVDGRIFMVPFPKDVPGGTTEAKPLPTITPKVHDLGGVARVLALARQSGSDQRLLVIIQTLTDKPEKAILRYKQGQMDPSILRWPRELGLPVAAAWSTTFVAAVVTDKGETILFNDEGLFQPMVAVIPQGKALPVPGRGNDKLWLALADSANPQLTVLGGVGLPFDLPGLDSTKEIDSVRPILAKP